MTEATTTESSSQGQGLVRREFLKGSTGLLSGVALAGALSMHPMEQRAVAAGSGHAPVKRIASNSYAVNRLFKRRRRSSRQETAALKEKYGEITMLDFPQFTKDTYDGVRTMDLWSSLFGDVEDMSQFSSRDAGG